MVISEQVVGGSSIVAAFESSAAAHAAIDLLAFRGLGTDSVSLQRVEPQEARQPFRAGSPLSGAAGLGAAAGLVLGTLLGWMMGVGALEVPGVGPIVGVSTLATTLTMAIVGSGLGALAGTLWGLSIPDYRPSSDTLAPETELVVLTVRVLREERAAVREILISSGAYDLHSYQTPAVVASHGSEAAPALGDALDGQDDERPEAMNFMEGEEMGNDETGLDPNSATGTKGAFDPETGAYGTAGTPLTTGYGVSGSTIGLGSKSDENADEHGDFRGSTPDTKNYEAGGRGSADSGALQPDEQAEPVTSIVEPVSTNEGDTLGSRQPRDLYETSSGYASAPAEHGAEAHQQNLVGLPTATEAREPGQNDRSGASQAVSDAADPDAQASQGTNVEGSDDPRGLGDNTDETSGS